MAIRTAELFKSGIAPYILVTGGHGSVTQNCMYYSEAQTFSNIMVDLGVPWGKIEQEPYASNLGENFAFSHAIIQDRFPYVKYICVVTKPAAQRRVKAAFEMQMKDYTCKVTAPQLSYNWYISSFYKDEEAFNDLICLLVADTYKFYTYWQKGYQVEVDVPKNIIHIAEQLALAGFDKYL